MRIISENTAFGLNLLSYNNFHVNDIVIRVCACGCACAQNNKNIKKIHPQRNCYERKSLVLKIIGMALAVPIVEQVT